MLVLRVGSQFVCWNSFAAAYYLGPERLSEVFVFDGYRYVKHHTFGPVLDRVFDRFPSAAIKWLRS